MSQFEFRAASEAVTVERKLSSSCVGFQVARSGGSGTLNPTESNGASCSVVCEDLKEAGSGIVEDGERGRGWRRELGERRGRSS